MYIDNQLLFSSAQAITATAASTNVIDLGLGDTGRSKVLVLVEVMQVFNNLTSLNIKLQTAVDAAFTTPIDLPENITPLLAALTANSQQLLAPLPMGCLRYLRVYYTVTGTAPTTGTIYAGLIHDPQANP